jgi:site-specific recombinase XerD
MVKRKYIHDYENQYNNYKKKIEDSKNISINNKKLIFEFDRDCKLKEHLETPTLVKYFDVLRTIAIKYTKKDFNKLEKKDYESIVEQVEKRDDITVSTKQKYRAIIKKFGRWLAYGDKIFNGMQRGIYPETILWINTSIKNKDRPKIKASDILTEEEVEKIINSAEHPRDRALLSILYETGCRIGELGNLQIKDIKEVQHGYLLDISGKTGARTPIIVFSAGKLAQWLNQHPNNTNKEAYVWCSLLNDKNNNKIKGEPLSYRGLSKILKRAVIKAKITGKRIYPHLLRHSRVTNLLKDKQLNEQQAKIYFGWSPSSTMLSQYSHLTSVDVNKTMLSINGIEQEERVNGKKMVVCQVCKKPNNDRDSFCFNCGRPLNEKIILKIEELKSKASELQLGVLKSNMNVDEYLNMVIDQKLKEMAKK